MPVMSVNGPVAGADLGRTLVHEHIIIGLPGQELDPRGLADRREIVAIAVDELQRLKAHGVDSLVDPCPIELGRDPELYAEVSQRSGVNIIFATGFYMEDLGIPMYWRSRDADEIADFYLKELTDGVGSTGLRPGVIKAATGMDVTSNEEKCLTGAGMAQRQADCAIITHTQRSRHGARQQEIFADAGADLSRVLIGHQDEQPTPEPIIALAERSFVGIDRVGLDSLASDDTRADNVAALVKAGFGGRVCLSHDCVCTMASARFPFPMPRERRPANVLQDWQKTRKPLSFLVTDFLPRLKARGVDDAQIDTILRDNPSRLLTGAS